MLLLATVFLTVSAALAGIAAWLALHAENAGQTQKQGQRHSTHVADGMSRWPSGVSMHDLIVSQMIRPRRGARAAAF